MTKLAPALLSLALFAPLAAQAQHHGHHGHHGHAAPATTASADSAKGVAEGTVRRVDAARGTVSIAHGPIPHMNMAPMTMSFNAAEGVDLSTLKTGDKIRFEASDQGGKLMLHGFEAAN